MTRQEWTEIAAYLSAGVGKPMGREQAEVYYDLLADLDVAAVRHAARLSLLESKYPTLPPVGTLRALAVQARAPAVMPWPEAWSLACRAAADYGLHKREAALAAMTPALRAAVVAVGWQALCDADPSDMDTLRAQFRDAYGTLSLRDDRERLLPEAMRREVAALTANIGLLPGGGES